VSVLSSILRERIEDDGPIPFSVFMAEALYHPTDGFYAVHGRAGRRGDFLTGPEVGPLFGALIARYLDRCWDRLGRPDPFSFVDFGAGPATLARSISLSDPACLSALNYIAVETSASQRLSHPDWVHSTDELVDRAHVLFANELLDNVPFDVGDADTDQLLLVGIDDGGFVEVWPEGTPNARVPIQHNARSLTEQILQRCSGGFVLVVDYMRAQPEDFVGQRWLRTYSDHERGTDPLVDPGHYDITADVGWAALTSGLVAPRRLSQAEFLTELGIEELVAEGKATWSAGAARGDLEALRGRSRVAEAEALTDTDGLGGFTVLDWDLRGVDNVFKGES
jgi:SAM-dependent MidA family methyltransferase